MLGGYIDFFMDPNLAECYVKLKDELDKLLQKKVRQFVNPLCTAEIMCGMHDYIKYNSKDIQQIFHFMGEFHFNPWQKT